MTILVILFGAATGLIGLLGTLFMLEPMKDYDVAAPPEMSSADAMRAVNAVCRLDEMEEVAGDASCVVPLASHDEPLDDYGGVPLMLKLSCLDLIDLVGEDAYGGKRPVPCEPVGKCYSLDVHDETFQLSMKARYPRFGGEVMEPPTESELEDERDNRVIFLGLLAIGLTGVFGGGLVLRQAWRRRKRAIEAL